MPRRKKHVSTITPPMPKTPKTYQKSFFQLLPRIGFAWSHHAKPCDTDKVAMFHIHLKNVESIMHAFRDLFPINSRGRFDVVTAGLVMGALESRLDIRKMKLMDFRPKAKASGVSALHSHHRMTPQAAYDFVFWATNARRRFLSVRTRQQQIGIESNLAKAVDSLVDQFTSKGAPRDSSYLAYVQCKDWDTCMDAPGISEMTPPGQDSRPADPDIAANSSDNTRIDPYAGAIRNVDIEIDPVVEPGSDDAMHVDPGVEDSSDDAMHIDPGEEDSGNDAMHIDLGVEDNRDDRMHIDLGLEVSSDDNSVSFEPLQRIGDVGVALALYPRKTTVEDRLASGIGALCIEDTEQVLKARADVELDLAIPDG